MMNEFQEKIHSIFNIAELTEMKNRIKNQVTDPTLRWDQRMELYKQVQMINHWIAELHVKKRG